MTSRSTSPAKATSSRKALLKRLGCLGSLSLFSSGVALAQTPSPSMKPAVTVAAPDVVADPEPPAVVIKRTPVASIAPPEMAPVAQASPQAAPEPQPPIERPAVPAPVAVPAPAPTPQELVGQPPVSPSPSAQGGYEAPSQVVVTERSSGCEFAVQAGQISACGATSKPTTVQAKPSGIAHTISNVISGVARPKFASPAPTGEATGPASVQVGPINVSSSGMSWNSGAGSSVGEAYSTVQSYYNRTLRPIGLPGNGNISLLFPLSLPSAITSLFGMRVNPVSGLYRYHTGTDIGAPMGTPVLAALTGRVIMAQYFGGYGVAVGLEHLDGSKQTLYAHLSEVFVKPGDIVQQGTAIGRVGSTGNSTGPHLHFEYRQQMQDGSWVAADPGFALEKALAQLTNSLKVSQNTVPQTRAQ